MAGGLLFSIGDISTKLATQGSTRLAFVITLVIAAIRSERLLQLGYQRGGALTVAGLATLLSTALPIAAGRSVLHEPVPAGVLGALRVLAFVAVTEAHSCSRPPKTGPLSKRRGQGLLARRRLWQRNKVASAPAAASAPEDFPAETTARPNPTPERGPKCSARTAGSSATKGRVGARIARD